MFRTVNVRSGAKPLPLKKGDKGEERTLLLLCPFFILTVKVSEVSRALLKLQSWNQNQNLYLPKYTSVVSYNKVTSSSFAPHFYNKTNTIRETLRTLSFNKAPSRWWYLERVTWFTATTLFMQFRSVNSFCHFHVQHGN